MYDLLFQAAADTLLPGREESEAPRWRHWRADGASHVGPAAAAPSPRPLRRADGRLAPDGTRWIHTRPRFFLPIPVLRQLFRGKLVAGVRDAFRNGRLHLPGSLAPLNTAVAFRAFLRLLYRQTWVVYAKPPFGSPAHVLHYLARYTHRVAISNHRLVAITDDAVSFRWKDYRHGSRSARSRSTSTSFCDAFSSTCCRSASSASVTSASSLRARGPAGWLVVARSSRSPHHRRTPAGDPTSTRFVAVSSLRRAHAPHRTTDARQLVLDALLAEIVHDTS